MNISTRIQQLLNKPSAIVIGSQVCSTDPYSTTNPDGYLNFGIAENHLMHDLLLKKMNEKLELSEEHIHYDGVFGLEKFKFVIADFFEKFLNIKNINPNHIVIQSGVSSVCEALSFALFDEDDYILIPTPYYTGFDHDFTKRFKVNFLKAHLSHDNNLKHNIQILKKTYLESPNKDKVKAILLTNPHNPTGEILSETFIHEIIEFAKEFDLHIISDEIYALSSHENTDHISLFQRAVDKGAKAHLLYGIAKDFSMAGFKVGFYFSHDEQLVEAMSSLTYFHPVGTPTQQLVHNLLSDHTFINNFKSLNSERLNKTKRELINSCDHLRFIESEAGLFIMLDLSTWCETFEDESKISEDLLHNFKINFSKGADLGMNRPGYFRVCFARPIPQINELSKRLKNFKRPINE